MLGDAAPGAGAAGRQSARDSFGIFLVSTSKGIFLKQELLEARPPCLFWPGPAWEPPRISIRVFGKPAGWACFQGRRLSDDTSTSGPTQLLDFTLLKKVLKFSVTVDFHYINFRRTTR